jgi:hypothetical protein
MSARVDRGTSTLWNPTGSEERPLSGCRKYHGRSPTSPKPQQQPFSASHGEGAHRIASIHKAQRRKLIPYLANSRKACDGYPAPGEMSSAVLRR